jgi:hypothetical protein
MINRISYIVAFFLLVGCTEPSVIPPSPSKTLLTLSEDTLSFIRNTSSNKPVLFLPSIFGHEKLVYVPISYYAPITDNSDVVLRILIPVIYDVDHGIVQPTNLNIYQCDSFSIDGTSLVFYSGTEISQIVNYPPQEGLSLTAPYTDSTIVMFLYEDTTLQIIPNIRYSSEWTEIPEKPIIGLYFLVSDYYLH